MYHNMLRVLMQPEVYDLTIQLTDKCEPGGKLCISCCCITIFDYRMHFYLASNSLLHCCSIYNDLENKTALYSVLKTLQTQCS